MTADESLRGAIRQNLTTYLRKLECNGDVEKQLYFKRNLLKKLTQSAIAIETDTANEQHYEVPTAFFKLSLGKRLKYSCCYWPEDQPGATIDDAEDVMLALTCERAQIRDGQTVMDLGCGWGSLALYICEKFPNCNVLTVSNSNTQREHIQKEAQRLGYGKRMQSITADANWFSTDKKFDRIVSLEMFEHMKNLERLFGRVASWLKPDGKLFIQILCHRAFPYEFDVRKGSDTEWMARNFFSGGTMLSTDMFLYFQQDVVLSDQWVLNGKHYSKTLEAWLKLCDQNKASVIKVFEDVYGKDQAKKHLFNWRLFFMFCSEVFGFGDGNEWVVAQYLFQNRHNKSML